MKSALQRRWRHWVQARHPLSDTALLGQRNIYIMPSPAGLAFCATLLVLLVGAINDQLSLGYLLTFLLGGAGFASMHLTHGNLRGLSFDLKSPEPAFAGDDLQLEIRVHNLGHARWGIGVQVQGSAFEDIAWADVPAQGHVVIHLRWPASRRGHVALPPLQITTRFPLGLFNAWSVWRPAAQAWIYPQAETPTPPFPAHPPAGGTQTDPSPSTRAASGRGQDFEGVRPYRHGDSMRQVLWKKAAQAQQGAPGRAPSGWWVRDAQAPANAALCFDWRDTAGLPLEARLSRLCAWVLAAERSQAPYQLRLGAQESTLGLGSVHRQQCLEWLALVDAAP
ncbi:DUF58 domain-containing protein [Roseateles koreensis]|uniref:DUF58 domain-containing protein n=1 Tax=Roseateles koreensis TaxID=2987526 RepID=A0ABT5KVL8_9BURK|nr:DUF58 domain-containing protein [Roseateles koreensis]MDC8786984.1 DUF58 domain-containing protein [Roseateles koreensis]